MLAPEDLIRLANLFPAGLASQNKVIAGAAPEAAIVMQIDHVGRFWAALAERLVLTFPNSNQPHTLKGAALLEIFVFWNFFIWIGYFHTMFTVTFAPSLIPALWIRVLMASSKSGSVIGSRM